MEADVEPDACDFVMPCNVDGVSCQVLSGIVSENYSVWLCIRSQNMYATGFCVCMLLQVNSVLIWTWAPCWRGVR